MAVASTCDFANHSVKVYWLQWSRIAESLPKEAARQAAAGNSDIIQTIYVRLTTFLEQTVRVSARCRTAFRKQKMNDGHEITSLCLNEFEKDMRDRVVAFTGIPNSKGVSKNHRVSLLQVFHACRHTIEVDRVVCAPFSRDTPAPNISLEDLNLYAGMVAEEEAHKLDKEQGWDPKKHAHLWKPLVFHIEKVLCGGHLTKEENTRAFVTTMRWLSDMVRNCNNPRLCLLFCGGQRIGKSWFFDNMRKYMLGPQCSQVYDSPRDFGDFTRATEGVVFNQFEELQSGAKNVGPWLKNFVGGQDLSERLLFKNGRQVANTGRTVLTTDDASKLGIPKDRCEQYERVFACRCCEKYKTPEYLAQLVACGTGDHWVAFYRYLYHYSEVDPIPFTCVGASNAAEYAQKYTTQVHHSEKKMVQEFIDYLITEKEDFLQETNAKYNGKIPTKTMFEEFHFWAQSENLECAKGLRHSVFVSVLVDLLKGTDTTVCQSKQILTGLDGKSWRPNVFEGLSNERTS